MEKSRLEQDEEGANRNQTPRPQHRSRIHPQATTPSTMHGVPQHNSPRAAGETEAQRLGNRFEHQAERTATVTSATHGS